MPYHILVASLTLVVVLSLKAQMRVAKDQTSLSIYAFIKAFADRTFATKIKVQDGWLRMHFLKKMIIHVHVRMCEKQP